MDKTEDSLEKEETKGDQKVEGIEKSPTQVEEEEEVSANGEDEAVMRSEITVAVDDTARPTEEEIKEF